MYLTSFDHVKAYERLVRERQSGAWRQVVSQTTAPAQRGTRVVLHVRPA